MALLDQQFKWSSQLTQAAPSVVLGTRAVFDADAVAVALRLLSDRDRTVLPDQQLAIVNTNNLPPVDPAPFATATMGSIGVPLWPYLASLSPDQRNALEQSGVVSDSHALDLRRLTAGATDTVGTNTQGMLFWYHALASRMDDDIAWRTALGWRGDDVRLDTTGSTMCVIAKVTIDAPVANVALFAFTAWAAAAPTQSGTTMTPTTAPDGRTTFAIHACDPGEGVPTNDGTTSLAFGGAPLRVQQFVELTLAKRSIASAQAACAVYGDDPVTIADERPLFDPTSGWTAPSKHPAPDPTSAACAAFASAASGGTTNADGSTPVVATAVPTSTVPASTVPAKKKP
jgi:P pilus assembly chaperone PapD